jgi:hypothetical protein
MPKGWVFRVVVAGPGHGVGIEASSKAEAEADVKFSGGKIAVRP